MKPFRFHPEALDEYDEAARWYQEREDALVNELVSLVDEAVDRICVMPEAWPRWPGRLDLHRYILQQFPYSIIYLVDTDAIVIIAVAHHKRRPGYWLPRVRAR